MAAAHGAIHEQYGQYLLLKYTVPGSQVFTVPVVVPLVVPEVVPEVVPLVVPAVVPAVVPEVVPAVVPDVVPLVVPAVVPEVVPPVVPEVVPEVVEPMGITGGSCLQLSSSTERPTNAAGARSADSVRVRFIMQGFFC